MMKSQGLGNATYYNLEEDWKGGQQVHNNKRPHNRKVLSLDKPYQVIICAEPTSIFFFAPGSFFYTKKPNRKKVRFSGNLFWSFSKIYKNSLHVHIFSWNLDYYIQKK